MRDRFVASVVVRGRNSDEIVVIGEAPSRAKAWALIETRRRDGSLNGVPFVADQMTEQQQAEWPKWRERAEEILGARIASSGLLREHAMRAFLRGLPPSEVTVSRIA